MSRIVNGEAVDRHIVKKYHFKDLDLSGEDEAVDDISDIEEIDENSIEEEVIHHEKENNNEIIEKLLLKIEELSNNIVNIQNQFSSQLNECKSQIEVEKKRAFEEGYNKGKEEGISVMNAQLQEKLELLQNSIQKVDSVEKLFEEKVLSIEKELVAVALDIAKEVIQKEISDSSKEVALNLAKALMEDIKDATKVEIKVNPKDAEYLQNNLKNVVVVPDEAVKEGGVVIVSDIGNIDAEIKNRFANIKEAILKEHSND